MDNDKQCKLAIVIPAYKSVFLRQTLDSLFKQTCKNFRLYIGDDASPENISGIVDEFRDKIDIFYHRFDKNVGSKDLVKHWDRCIALSNGEPYIMLFSDDDEMSENAVSSFYREIEKYEDYDLYRFDLVIINESNNVINECPYPDFQGIRDFFTNRVHESIYSCITQYIFTRSAYDSCNGFVSFPFAWFSDDASIIKFAFNTGIKKIQGATVKWRLAETINITASNKYEDKKARAVFEYALWFNNYFRFIFSRDEIKKLTFLFLSKRMVKIQIAEYFKFSNLESILKLSGLTGGLYLFLYITYYRLKTKGNS